MANAQFRLAALVLLICSSLSFHFPLRRRWSFIRIEGNNRCATRAFCRRGSSSISATSIMIEDDTSNYLKAFVVIPALSLFLPSLLHEITDLNNAGGVRQICIVALLLAKRVYLYSTAAQAMVISAERSVAVAPELGQRFMEVNDDILGTITPPNSTSVEASIRREAYTSLDGIEANQQAAAIPIIVALSLLASFYLVNTKLSDVMPLFSGGASPSDLEYEAFTATLKQAFSVLSSATVCFLFTRSEFSYLIGRKFRVKGDGGVSEDGRESMKDDHSASILARKSAILTMSSAISAITVLTCYLASAPTSLAAQFLWPVHNIVNSCIAITVSRIAQLPRLPAVVLAILGMVLYDSVFVLATSQYTDAGSSIMEAVARTRLGDAMRSSSSAAGSEAMSAAGTAIAASIADSNVVTTTLASFDTTVASWIAAASAWQPGLFEVRLDGHVTDALGLGDVIFPAMLAGWALRYDIDTSTRADDVKRGDGGVAEQELRLGRTVVAGGEEDKGLESKTGRELMVVPENSSKVRGRGRPIYTWSLIGYGVGLFLCEVFQTGSGQPALLYIVPSMLLAVFGAGLARNELTHMWSYNEC